MLRRGWRLKAASLVKRTPNKGKGNAVGQRTWVERQLDEGHGSTRWDMLLDGKPVEGAYIERSEQGDFDLHFPRLKPTSAPTLEQAQRILEGAPLTRRSGIAIGRSADAEEETIEVDEAAAMLGVSRGRVNAMVANGVLAALRKDGIVRVGVQSILNYLGRENDGAPQGRFAHKFVQYFPDADGDAFILLEVDADNEEQVSHAKAFVDRVRNDSEHPAGARVVGYRAAMRLRSASSCLHGRIESGIMPYGQFSEKDFLPEWEDVATA